MLTMTLGSRYRAGATVAHGSLLVPATADRDFTIAAAYLSRDTRMRDIIDRAERMPHELDLAIVHDGNDRYDPNSHTVYWDPYSALATTMGGRQSPALGLGHELDHATAAPRTLQSGQRRFDSAYDNAEERRVITGSETHAARTLGESVRHDHAGRAYTVGSPIVC